MEKLSLRYFTQRYKPFNVDTVIDYLNGIKLDYGFVNDSDEVVTHLWYNKTEVNNYYDLTITNYKLIDTIIGGYGKVSYVFEFDVEGKSEDIVRYLSSNVYSYGGFRRFDEVLPYDMLVYIHKNNRSMLDCVASELQNVLCVNDMLRTQYNAKLIKKKNSFDLILKNKGNNTEVNIHTIFYTRLPQPKQIVISIIENFYQSLTRKMKIKELLDV
jgi:hypothetical protein